ncbi:Fungal ADAM-like protein [Pleurostoma richardsiae]|uniref:Disintegrin and metalloproteinase domain-containing protein B n=1 Tax=Pleurostoma richardsiae TaxID=41990 RepID=A0AA38RRK0_9PEZI|nr:Fungal ADAM-like protein [Pleurostoma richardsiae]
MHVLKATTAALAIIGPFVESTAAHSITRNPLDHVSRVVDPTLHTPSHRIHALSAFDLTFILPDRREEFRLSVSPNEDILHENAVVRYLAQDGTDENIEPIDRFEHRIFRGQAFVRQEGQVDWIKGGWARIAVHRDGPRPVFEGVFTVHGEHHHVQTSGNYRHTKIPGDPDIKAEQEEYMVIWKDSDFRRTTYEYKTLRRQPGVGTTCQFNDLHFNVDPRHPVRRGTSLDGLGDDWDPLNHAQISERQYGTGSGVDLVSTIGSTAGCPTTRKIALLGIAADCTYTRDFDSVSAVRSNIVQQINSASELYESTFNISLQIQNLTISDANCPATAPASAPWNLDCTSDVTISDRLGLFSQWRGDIIDTNAFWTLLSLCNTGSAVGLSWMGQVCRRGSSNSYGDGETAAGANVVIRTPTEWQVIAHEAGHIFGAVHDCTSDTCSDGSSETQQQCCPLSASTCDADGQYMMNPSTGSSISQFSPCSIGNICSAIGRRSVNASCLVHNTGVTTISGSRCGNGIVEAGEDCDCGGTAGCGDNPCCDPTTCRFTTNSVCDPANGECCTDQCQFASSNTTCRASTGACDPAEVCTGSSSTCPDDTTSPDGTSCGDSGDGLTCASGQCTSRDLQCRDFMSSRADNVTRSCNPQTCRMSCMGRTYGGVEACFSMQQNFLDGTDCEGGGRCRNGNCEDASVSGGSGGSGGSGARRWIDDHRTVVISVASVEEGPASACCGAGSGAGSGSSTVPEARGLRIPAAVYAHSDEAATVVCRDKICLIGAVDSEKTQSTPETFVEHHQGWEHDLR